MSEFDAQLKGLTRKLEGISDLASHVAEEASKEIATLIQRQFDRGVDPDGNRWASLAETTIRRGRHAPPLTDTGEMRHTVTCTPEGPAIRIRVEGPAVYHQYGTQSMPARHILPEGSLPKSWIKALRGALKEAIDAH